MRQCEFNNVLVIGLDGSSQSILFRNENCINFAYFSVINIPIFENVVVFLLDALQIFVLQDIWDEFMIMTNEIKLVFFFWFCF